MRLNSSIRKIREHKFLFLLLILLHVLFISAALLLIIDTQSKVINDLQDINSKINNMNLDADEVQAGAQFLPEATQIHATYTAFKERLRDAFFALAAIIIIGNTIIWAVAFRIFDKRNRLVKIASFYVIGVGLLALFGYSLLVRFVPIGISLEAMLKAAKLFGLGFLVILFLVIVATMNSHRTWKNLFSNYLKMVLPFFIVIGSIAAGIFIIYRITYSTWANWIPIAFLIFTVLLSFARVFMINETRHT
tara:strand:- start:7756 stop:8502 length:747 start_codon:yes stop_codon:yes gene_type:complete